MRVANPAQSGRAACGVLDSSISRLVMASAAMPIGRFTRKMPLQLIPVVITPPSTGPSATATPVIAPQIPKATPRSWPRKLWARSASDVAKRMAPPMPWALRERISMIGDWATPQSSEPSVKTMRPTVKRRRRP